MDIQLTSTSVLLRTYSRFQNLEIDGIVEVTMMYRDIVLPTQVSDSRYVLVNVACNDTTRLRGGSTQAANQVNWCDHIVL